MNNFIIQCKHCGNSKFRIVDNTKEILNEFWERHREFEMIKGVFTGNSWIDIDEEEFKELKKSLLNRKVIIMCDNGDCDCSEVKG